MWNSFVILATLALSVSAQSDSVRKYYLIFKQISEKNKNSLSIFKPQQKIK